MNDAQPPMGRALAWASYLACSWTWCIGMFLPVLLIRDYGAWGFVVFAVPNVFGAAAFGWVLASREASERLVGMHRQAMASFSLVTCAFHGFFLGWLASSLPGQLGPAGTPWGAIAGAVVAVPLLALTFQTRLPAPGWWARASVGVLAFSALILGARLLAWPPAGGVPPPAPDAGSGRHLDSIVWLAPVTVLGFTLCPYLDATFHRARQSLSARDARISFAVGFGGLFLAMILLTLTYADVFLGRAAGALLVAAHIVVQALFTCGVHTREAHQGLARLTKSPVAVAIVPTAAGMLIGVLSDATLFDLSMPTMSRAEIAYRGFMAFYGLVFPAYVWLCVIPTRDGHSGVKGASGRWKLRVLWLAVGIAAPMYWMGFIERREVWLAPGVMVVLLARLVLPRARS